MTPQPIPSITPMTIESIYKAGFVNLEKGDLVYYASFIATSEDRPHLLQLTQVQKVNDTTVFLDNGKKFSINLGIEMCRGDGGCLYEYSTFSEAMVKESQAKLSVLNNVEAIDFSALSLQQLSMILDVSRGAFTQVSNYTPCGGGCTEVEPDALSGTTTPVMFADATFTLSNSEEDEDEDYDDESDDEDYELVTNLRDTDDDDTEAVE